MLPASLFSKAIESIAAEIDSAEACSFLMLVVIMPVPSGFVNRIASPVSAPEFFTN